MRTKEEIFKICAEKRINIRYSKENYFIPPNSIYWDFYDLDALNHELEHALEKNNLKRTWQDLKEILKNPKLFFTNFDFVSIENRKVYLNPPKFIAYLIYLGFIFTISYFTYSLIF